MEDVSASFAQFKLDAARLAARQEAGKAAEKLRARPKPASIGKPALPAPPRIVLPPQAAAGTRPVPTIMPSTVSAKPSTTP